MAAAYRSRPGYLNARRILARLSAGEAAPPRPDCPWLTQYGLWRLEALTSGSSIRDWDRAARDSLQEAADAIVARARAAR